MGFRLGILFCLRLALSHQVVGKKESTIYLYTVETIENATRGELQPD